MNIAFWDNQLCERGATVAIYDYAYYNEKNKALIVEPRDLTNLDKIILNVSNVLRSFGCVFMSFWPIYEISKIFGFSLNFGIWDLYSVRGQF